MFLELKRGAMDSAENFYKKALEENQKDALTHALYGDFLERICNEKDVAEEHYKTALGLNPNLVYALERYAEFLEKVRNDFQNCDDL